MINKIAKIKAMTLAEVLVMFFIVGIVASATIGISRSKIDYATKYLYYSTFDTMKKAVGIMMADGFNSPTTLTLERALPNKAHLQDPAHASNWIGLCDVMTNIINTVGPNNCASEPLLNDASNFATATPTFVATNGIAYYNFGANPTAIVGVDVTTQVYTVYVDINGVNSGKSQLNVDVMKFQIDRGGNVFPAYDSTAASSTKYLSTSIKYNNAGLQWLSKGLSYRQGACQSGIITNATYCPGGVDYTKNAICCNTASCSAGTYPCTLVVNKP